VQLRNEHAHVVAGSVARSYRTSMRMQPS